jgi:hypothetical protein
VKRSFSILKCNGHQAAAWFRARTERVQILIAFIPSLRDAFNADDLPLFGHDPAKWSRSPEVLPRS